jgi:hypothetical protein
MFSISSGPSSGTEPSGIVEENCAIGQDGGFNTLPNCQIQRPRHNGLSVHSPGIGPGSNSQNRYSIFINGNSQLASWMLTMVGRKPIELIIVSAEPMHSPTRAA